MVRPVLNRRDEPAMEGTREDPSPVVVLALVSGWTPDESVLCESSPFNNADNYSHSHVMSCRLPLFVRFSAG